jgi:hypothetical protein
MLSKLFEAGMDLKDDMELDNHPEIVALKKRQAQELEDTASSVESSASSMERAAVNKRLIEAETRAKTFEHRLQVLETKAEIKKKVQDKKSPSYLKQEAIHKQITEDDRIVGAIEIMEAMVSEQSGVMDYKILWWLKQCIDEYMGRNKVRFANPEAKFYSDVAGKKISSEDSLAEWEEYKTWHTKHPDVRVAAGWRHIKSKKATSVPGSAEKGSAKKKAKTDDSD